MKFFRKSKPKVLGSEPSASPHESSLEVAHRKEPTLVGIDGQEKFRTGAIPTSLPTVAHDEQQSAPNQIPNPSNADALSNEFSQRHTAFNVFKFSLLALGIAADQVMVPGISAAVSLLLAVLDRSQVCMMITAAVHLTADSSFTDDIG
jgi:hypothetical protein